jgi:nitrite reductase/ring-hydroxylating ferredoxin subunit
MSDVVAVYERRIRASVDRIWENVLDWEHLPHLHSQAFERIELLESSRDHWRASLVLGGMTSGQSSEVEVRLARSAFCYVTRTVAGAGAGTEIETWLVAIDERNTDIRVEFRVPDLPEEAREPVGAFYLALYGELWDQDEQMMIERQAFLDARRLQPPDGAHDGALAAGVELGGLEALRSRLPLDLDVGGQRLRVDEVDGALRVWSRVCPHMGRLLDQAVVRGGCIECPWHGYRFDVATGRRVGGDSPHMRALPELRIEDGLVRLTWSS